MKLKIKHVLLTILGLGVYFSGDFLTGTVTILRDAGNLTRGTLPNGRVDKGSVTARGQLNTGSQSLVLASATVYGAVISTTGFFGPANGLTNIPPGSSPGLQEQIYNIVSTNIVNNTIVAVDLASGSVSGGTIVNGSISSTQIGFETIRSTNIFDAQISSSDIAIDAVDGARILDRSIGGTDIDLLTIVNGNLANGIITGRTMNVEFIVSSHIAQNTIQGQKFAGNVVLSSHIADNTIQGRNIGSLIVVSSHIVHNTIQGQKFADSVVISSHIVDATIANSDLANNSVDSAKITAAGVAGKNLSESIIMSSHVTNGIILSSVTFISVSSMSVTTGRTTLNTVAYTWPSSDGSSGQVLETNGSGALTWAADDTGAGGSGTTEPETYAITIGTVGTPGVRVATNNVNFNVIAQMLGERSGSNFKGGAVFFRRGVYQVQDATIPAGMTVMGEGYSTEVDSGTVFISSSATQNTSSMLTLYGEIRNITFDFNATAFTAGRISMRSGSRMRDCVMLRGSGAGVGRAHMLEIKTSSNIVVEGLRVHGARMNKGGVVVNGDDAPFLVENSTNVQFYRMHTTSGMIMAGNGNGTFFSVFGGSDFSMIDGRFEQTGGRFFNMNNGANVLNFSRNTFYINDRTAGDGGVINIQPFGQNRSSGTVIDSNRFLCYWSGTGDGTDNTNCIGVQSGGSATTQTSTVDIRNNYAVYLGLGATNDFRFCEVVDSGCIGTIFRNNTVWNLGFLLDSGTGTQSATLGNFLNGVQQ